MILQTSTYPRPVLSPLRRGITLDSSSGVVQLRFRFRFYLTSGTLAQLKDGHECAPTNTHRQEHTGVCVLTHTRTEDTHALTDRLNFSPHFFNNYIFVP